MKGVTMTNISLEKAIQLFDNGDITIRGVYNACDTDLDFYNFLGNYLCLNPDDIKEKMRSVSGTDDAYYNALALADYELLWEN